MIHHRRACHESDAFDINDEPKMSMLSTGFVIVNLYLGYGLLAFPFALSRGGLISLIALAVICWLMSWTGKLLVRSFNRMRPQKRTFTDIGYKSFGKYGSTTIAIGVFLQFMGTFCVNTIFLWENSQFIIDSFTATSMHSVISMRWISSLCTILVLPTMWILNLSEMSFVPFIGVICKILAIFVIAVCFVLNFDGVIDHIRSGDIAMYPENVESISMSIGIYLFSFTAHPVLPAVYAAMSQPDRFEVLLDRCFVALFVIFTTVSLWGYIPFAEDTEVIITGNLMWKHENSDGPNRLYRLYPIHMDGF